MTKVDILSFATACGSGILVAGTFFAAAYGAMLLVVKLAGE